LLIDFTRKIPFCKYVSPSGIWVLRFQLKALSTQVPQLKKIQMKFKLITLFLILTTSFASFGQEKQSRKSKSHNSAVAEKGQIKVSIMYPFAEGKTFNMEYYETKHMPMVAGFLGSNW
jgi:hypothetical protein